MMMRVPERCEPQYEVRAAGGGCWVRVVSNVVSCAWVRRPPPRPIRHGPPARTVFVGEPNDNGNPLVGTLNLSTGQVTPLGNTFASPKGLLFLPSGQGEPLR